MSDWFEETVDPRLRLRLEILETLHEERHGLQRLVLFRSPLFGRVLALDGAIQTTEGDEFIYHEILAHVPVLAHGAVRRALIVGGGDGGMAEELLKHRTVEHVTLVEIDPAVIDFSRTHLRAICGDAFDDPRLAVEIADGAAFVADSRENFDLIIVDSTDPEGPGEVLFSEAFYRNCRDRLAPGGVLATQAGVPFTHPQTLRRTGAAHRALFADASCFLAAVPSYSGGAMAFGWASDDPALRQTPVETLSERFAAAGLATRYYTPEVHRAAFALPPYVSELLA
ncbi:MAG: polyamine aminopropyltransferase [Alphaproteobacteria bacterium]|nr:polyamine aminopropyltransferase [Alphaproteobacteria bacterium]